MKKIAMTLVMAGLLSGAACSRSKDDAAETAKASPSPSLQTRMEQQQKAIDRASEEIRKEQERKAAAGQASTPAPN